MEFPVIDGVPVIVADPAGFLRNARAHVLARDDLPAALEGLLGDALGAGGELRHDAPAPEHLLPTRIMPTGRAAGRRPTSSGTLQAGLGLLGRGATGRRSTSAGRSGAAAGSWRGGLGPVLVGDLNFAFLRLAQRLMLEGEARFGRRRVGLVYDPVRIVAAGGARDGARWTSGPSTRWRCRSGPGAFGLATAINLVDSIAGPTEAIAEAARVLAPGGGAVFATPHDWSPNVAEPARWMGGHSQRGPARRRGRAGADGDAGASTGSSRQAERTACPGGCACTPAPRCTTHSTWWLCRRV